MNLRKGDSTGIRDTSGPSPTDMHGFLTLTPTDELGVHLPRATRAELIDAHRWCEGRDGHTTRKIMIARQLRKIS